jgi:hypothetical protein
MLYKSLSFQQTRNEQSNIFVRFWSIPSFAFLMVLFVVLRFWHLTSYSLWGGETFIMVGVQKGWDDMFAYIVADIVHPPLFYVLVKLWIMIGGNSLLWLKLLPVLCGVALVAPFLLLCRELKFRLPEVNLALLIIAVNGYLIHYAQELRMYSLFMFLAICSFWLFIRFFNSPGRNIGQLLLLTIVNLLTIYTHYYGWIVVGMEFLFLLVWHRQKVLVFALSILFLLLCFSPWAYLVVREARAIGGLESNLGWIPKPGVDHILKLYVMFNGPLGDRYVKLFGLALFGLPVFMWGWRLAHPRYERSNVELVRFSWLVLLAFLPVVALALLSQWMPQATWTDRYFIFIAIPYMMLVATAVYQIKHSWLRYSWVAAIVLWSVLAGFNDLRTNRMAWEGLQLGSRVDWDSMVQQMVAANAVESSTQVTVYTLTPGDWALSNAIDYFLEQQGEYGFQIKYAGNVYRVLEQADEDYFWVTFFELEEWPQASPVAVLTNNGFRVGTEIIYQNQNDRIIFVPVWRQ